MSKLFPPQIEGSQALLIKQSNIGVLGLVVPFRMNEAVSEADIVGMNCLIKTVSTGLQKDNLSGSFSLNEVKKRYEAAFNVGYKDKNGSTETQLNKYQAGQYYKVQIAFVGKDDKGNDEIGYYSSTIITKCIELPTISIAGLNKDDINVNLHSYTGLYQTVDRSEKVASYCFTIYQDNKVYDTSGVLIHNNNNDIDSLSSNDSWISLKSLQEGVVYEIVYSITTTSGLEIDSLKYQIQMMTSADSIVSGDFIAKQYPEQGYIQLYFNSINRLQAGSYVVMKTSSKDNYNTWTEYFRLRPTGNVSNPTFGKDYALEQGISYKYKLQKVAQDSRLSEPVEAKCYNTPYDVNTLEYCTVDFEDAYLFDGERQLRIQYNPKVASFKSNILESKIDTIGGKYPFIFRNGDVNYKEFSISGLISALMDSDGNFMRAAARNNSRMTPEIENPATDLTGDNFRIEREFKTEVLDWLNNGKPKLFRSPGEGNFIIRTTNVSLTPNDTLGRMLHSFNCTAYEIAEYNEENLQKYGFIRNDEFEFDGERGEKGAVFKYTNKNKGIYNFGPYGGAYSLEILAPTQFPFWAAVYYANGQSTLEFFTESHNKISELNDDDIPIIALQIIGSQNFSINFNFSYLKQNESLEIQSLETTTQFCKLIGTSQTAQKETLIMGIKEKFTNVYSIQAQKKKIYNIISSETKSRVHYTIMGDSDKKVLATSSKKYLAVSDLVWHYALEDGNGAYVEGPEVYEWKDEALYYDIQNQKYYCGNPASMIVFTELGDTEFIINGQSYNLGDKENQLFTNLSYISELQLSNLMFCDIVCDKSTYTYFVEKEPLIQRHSSLQKAQTNYQNNSTPARYQILQQKIKTALQREKGGRMNDVQ